MFVCIPRHRYLERLSTWWFINQLKKQSYENNKQRPEWLRPEWLRPEWVRRLFARRATHVRRPLIKGERGATEGCASYLFSQALKSCVDLVSFKAYIRFEDLCKICRHIQDLCASKI